MLKGKIIFNAADKWSISVNISFLVLSYLSEFYFFPKKSPTIYLNIKAIDAAITCKLFKTIYF